MKPIAIVDLKTERSDVGQPLPSALRLLPVIFFAGILGTISFTAYAFWQIKIAEKKEAEAQTAEAAQKAEITRLTADEAAIEKEVKNATEAREWLLGTNQLQKLTKIICESMTPESTIAQLTLARRDEMASQVEMALTMNSAHGQQQVDQLRTAVSNALGYHSYSDNINNKGGKTEVTYDCTWIKGDSSEALPP